MQSFENPSLFNIKPRLRANDTCNPAIFRFSGMCLTDCWHTLLFHKIQTLRLCCTQMAHPTTAGEFKMMNLAFKMMNSVLTMMDLHRKCIKMVTERQLPTWSHSHALPERF